MILDEVGTEPNVTYLWFDDHEGAFLAGAAAALKTDTGTIGFVGGVDVPAVWQFQAGFDAGARAIDPEVEILSAYLTAPPDWTGSRRRPPRGGLPRTCTAAARTSSSTPQAAPGVGVFEAAADMSESSGRELWAIGVDADQYETIGRLPGVVEAERWRQHILTSVVNRFDDGSTAPWPTSRGARCSRASGTSTSSPEASTFLQRRLRRRHPAATRGVESQIIAGQIAGACLPARGEAADVGPGAVRRGAVMPRVMRP